MHPSFHDLGTDLLSTVVVFFFFLIQMLACEVKVWNLHLIWKRRVLAARLLLPIALLCFCCMVHSSLHLWASLSMGIWDGKIISLFLRARLKWIWFLPLRNNNYKTVFCASWPFSRRICPSWAEVSAPTISKALSLSHLCPLVHRLLRTAAF